MKLLRYKVTTFRSVMDSGWIDCDDITTLVGINEAGKSNLLLALWKLNPANDGKIDPLHDLPIKMYSSERENLESIPFITAEFELNDQELQKIEDISGYKGKDAKTVQITRYYDGHRTVEFTEVECHQNIDALEVTPIIERALELVSKSKETTKSEAGIQQEAGEILSEALEYVTTQRVLCEEDREKIAAILLLKKSKPAAHSLIQPIIENARDEIEKEFEPIFVESPTENQKVETYVIEHMPTFVYYSNYGNLDSQIYLPHAIKWLKGEKVPGIDNEAKVRTLRVLFDFVHLNPEEILNLGKDPKLMRNGYEHEPTKEEIDQAAEKKTERSILLQSASSELTQKFKQWWKQGTYIFRFEADGEYFKIWVSDDKRPEEVELEKRSTGLQWFLSFYLVFLVESQEAHKDSVLLLDEAGLSLHPLAQKDLIVFFESLAEKNQLIHTTHSPFLVDTNSIERVKVVYVDDQGHTVVSNDLRASNDKLNEKSIYAVHAALGLSVSDVLLQGCKPVIVEGPSDQHYLNAIKTFLIRCGKIFPKEEIVFMPSGGVKGIQGLVGIVASKSEELPFVILDSDKSGNDARRKIEQTLYQGQTEKIISVSDFSTVERAEIEDLIPEELMKRYMDRSLFRNIEDEEAEFEDIYDPNNPIVDQIQEFAKKYNVDLPKGWKVEMAKSVKTQLQRKTEEKVDEKYVQQWEELFKKFCD